MPRINLLPDDLYEPDLAAEPADTAPVPVGSNECPGCLGKGRYVGLFAVEDPCRFCNGSGIERPGGARSAAGQSPPIETDELPF